MISHSSIFQLQSLNDVEMSSLSYIRLLVVDDSVVENETLH
jgi:hypothetical protein